MTEADWLATADVPTLLRWAVPRGTRRQLRLYLCGGCLAIQGDFYRPESLDAVEVAERWADGLATDEELDRAHYFAESPTFVFSFEARFWRECTPKERTAGLSPLIAHGVLPPDYLWGDDWRVDPSARDRLLAAAYIAYQASGRFRTWEHQACEEHVDRWFHEPPPVVRWPGRWLVDCVYGNPFRPPNIASDWRTPTVLALAEGVYADRGFDRLPVLADALDDAGCADSAELAHCRGGGPHVRGCWVIDRLLDKPDEPATAIPG